MRKFITTILLFVLFAGAFYILILPFWGKYAPKDLKPNLLYPLGGYGHTFSRMKEVKSIRNTDILILGSSHSYRGFDPRIFKAYGFTAFNLGSSSQTPIQTKVLLKRYLDRINTKLIIYEVYPEIFSLDGVESALDIIANDKNDLYSAEMALKINNIKVYNAFIYAIIKDLFDLNSSFEEKIIKGDDKYISGGFVEKKIKFFKPEPFQAKKWQFNNTQFSCFKDIIEIFKKKKKRFILVYAPISPSLYKSISNKNVFDSLMNFYSTYYDFNEILRMSDTLHFYDSHHLNQNGVEIFNKELIELILKNKETNHL